MKLLQIQEASHIGSTKDLIYISAEEYKEDPIIIGPFTDKQQAKKFIESVKDMGFEFDYHVRSMYSPKEFYDYQAEVDNLP